MKKLFLFALAVTALFSSCEKNPDLSSTAIMLFIRIMITVFSLTNSVLIIFLTVFWSPVAV